MRLLFRFLSKCTTDLHVHHVAQNKYLCSFSRNRNRKTPYYWCIVGIVIRRLRCHAECGCNWRRWLSLQRSQHHRPAADRRSRRIHTESCRWDDHVSAEKRQSTTCQSATALSHGAYAKNIEFYWQETLEVEFIVLSVSGKKRDLFFSEQIIVIICRQHRESNLQLLYCYNPSHLISAVTAATTTVWYKHQSLSDLTCLQPSSLRRLVALWTPVTSTAVGTGPADPAAAGPIIWQTRIFLCSHYINFRERESILNKISKTGATRCQVLRLKCTKFDFPLAKPTALPTPRSCILSI